MNNEEIKEQVFEYWNTRNKDLLSSIMANVSPLEWVFVVGELMEAYTALHNYIDIIYDDRAEVTTPKSHS
jgi:hypothetical protein